MQEALPSKTLVRRIIEQYLLFGLAGLLILVILAIGLNYFGSFNDLVEWAIVIPLVILLLGAYALRRTASLHDMIELQITQVDNRDFSNLQPLPARGALAAGWNSILLRLKEQSTWDGVERRLSDVFGQADANRWQSIFDNLPDGILLTNSQGIITSANQASVVLFEVKDLSQIHDQDIFSLLEKFNLPYNATAWDKLKLSVQSIIVELQQGEELTQGVLRCSRQPFYDAHQSDSYLWTIRDITQQKLAETARNQFVFTATHELRTPLANIRAYAETLADAGEIPLEQQQEFYNIINTEATRLGRFVDELLNVSQLEAGSITVARHELDLERLLNEVSENLRPQAVSKQLQYDCKLPQKFPKIKADKDKLTGALVNLLGNAIKYTPAGGQVQLIVEVEQHQVLFHITDTGIGISPDDLPKMCQKFFRSDDARVQQLTGSGLGLAFAQEVARLHGGKLQITSELNKGSRFTLSIPL